MSRKSVLKNSFPKNIQFTPAPTDFRSHLNDHLLIMILTDMYVSFYRFIVYVKISI